MPSKPVVLINVLKVESKKQDALIALLKQNIDTVVRTLDGWKTTRLIAAADGATVVIYRARLKATFYGDVSESEFTLAASQLHCDEPVGAVTPSEITPGRFGAVPRHYIRCTQDRAIPLAGQDHMIATIDRAIGGKTTIHTLESSHSPFLSQPAALSKILIGICG